MQLDFELKKATNWYDEGAVPSEPFFVARPGATKEDDGKNYTARISSLCSSSEPFGSLLQLVYNF